MKKKFQYADLNDVEAIVLVADKNGNIVFANKAVKKILGYKPEDLLGNGWWELTAEKEDRIKRKETTASLASKKIELNSRHLFENPIKSKSGKIVWTQWTNTITKDGYLVGIAQDITEKKIIEEQLVKKNKENEILLREIHHRVKNNLQIISSLLNLQFSSIDNPNVIEALNKSKARIQAMALIHTKLFRSKDLSQFDFKPYLNELVATIHEIYSSKTKINTKVSFSGSILNVDLSINLGLIITELLTNAYKHAFNGMSEGLIEIKINPYSKNKYKLVIKDNGSSLYNNPLQNSKKSFGLELVKDLTKQIDGTLGIKANKGLCFTIIFENKM